MPFEKLLVQRVTITRLSDELLAETDIKPVIIGFLQPVKEASVKIKISGITNQGTVIIKGTVSGVSGITDEIIFFQPGIKQSKKEFSVLSEITTTGFPGGGKISLFSATLSGEPVFKTVTVSDSYPCRIDVKRGDLSQEISGLLTASTTKMYSSYSPGFIREKDRVYSENKIYEITLVEKIYGRNSKPHHFESTLKEI